VSEASALADIPKHIAVIMDGNGRWAKSKGFPRVFGHRSGTKATVEIVDACGKLGVKFLTLYVFSSENWQRPPKEVSFLMTLLVEMMDQEINHLMAENVKLVIIGDMGKLPERARKKLQEGIIQTSKNTGLQLNLAVSYGGRQEIVHATQKLAEQVLKGEISPESITESLFSQMLYLPEVPDPELMIRTGGEFRISNYLLWQLAYSEIYVTDVLWPDFHSNELDKAIEFYQKRQRRFGKVIDE
jgi:undecaprenyl diphosphate synthase